ncbi:LytTR family transcriptional regulator DNA-binding domain-containing protein [Jeotgalibacillus proteolyticus]|uniref:ABC transporter ATP-binding protein n=1 Tax=Jeotgalibacillus proteolyticus TaxID=2082395 RepID=A0A2S5G9W9_9BACL|nr:LytTR family transcriptional regulator DNA-binding domain-containing protein [Jeotgalibacillus proteolyticus]PPA69817.1 ABC transporter ATP-binding protein [Jeotgalibacillus proteolyticus]
MNLVTLENVMKQKNNRTVLKGIDLMIEEYSQIGIKMSREESELFFELLSGKITPSSGHIYRETNSVLADIREDGLYENLTVQGYLNFFKKISDFESSPEGYIAAFSLSDVWQTKIKRLTIDQMRRVSMFRMFLMSPKLLLIESPLTNLTDEGIELYLKGVEHLRNAKITILFTSHYIEELLLLSKEVYRYYPQTGLQKTDLAIEAEPDDEIKDEPKEIKPSIVYKVSSKLEDKTIFFSPDEIDFIESINSVSNIRIGEEYFPSDLTMNELEGKLGKFGFFRCHRSYLINLQRVSELVSYSKNSYTLILKGNPKVKLPLSRSRLEEMKELIGF